MPQSRRATRAQKIRRQKRAKRKAERLLTERIFRDLTRMVTPEVKGSYDLSPWRGIGGSTKWKRPGAPS